MDGAPAAKLHCVSGGASGGARHVDDAPCQHLSGDACPDRGAEDRHSQTGDLHVGDEARAQHCDAAACCQMLEAEQPART